MKKEDANFIIELKRKIHQLIVKKKIKKHSFTIISQNCLGGVIYNMLKMPFQSPTINLFIEDEDFVKLVENPKYYFSIEPVPYIEEYIEPMDSTIKYPLIKVGDIVIHCRHYENCQEAIEAWDRRRKRIDYDNIYIIPESVNYIY